MQSLLSSLCAGKLTPTSAPTLVRVAVARGRVLCPECRGENDDMFHFCQWCATRCTCYSIIGKGARLSIDEAALGARYTQLTTSLENKTSTVRREAATTLSGQSLSLRTTGGAVGMATAQPRDIVQYLCWLDSCSKRGRTVVHAMHCTGRNCGTLRVLNPTWRMRKAVRTRFLEDRLRFETGCGVLARSRHHHRLERCSLDRKPDQK